MKRREFLKSVLVTAASLYLQRVPWDEVPEPADPGFWQSNIMVDEETYLSAELIEEIAEKIALFSKPPEVTTVCFRFPDGVWVYGRSNL